MNTRKIRQRVLAVTLGVAVVLSGAAKCERQDAGSGKSGDRPTRPQAVGAPGAPMKIFPCQHSPHALIVQLWTYQPEPLRFRLDAFDEEGIPLVGNQGEPMANHVDTVVTHFAEGGVGSGHAVYELPLCFVKQVSGYVRLDGGAKVKMGVRFYVLTPDMRRSEVPQMQSGQGVVSVTYHVTA